jgi:hypothetical protein
MQMKLTNEKLKQLIKEELEAVINETYEEERFRSDYEATGQDPMGYGFADEHKPVAQVADSDLQDELEKLKDEREIAKSMGEEEDVAMYDKKIAALENPMEEAKSGDSNIQQIINQMLGMPEDMVDDAIAQYKAQKEKKDK